MLQIEVSSRKGLNAHEMYTDPPCLREQAGFPIASDGDFAAVRAVAAAVPRPVIAGLARAARHDIERAAEALRSAVRPRIHVFLATSDIHLQHNLRISRQQCMDQAAESVRLARTFCDDL